MARVKRDIRVEVAPGALGLNIVADYGGCAAVVSSFKLTPAGLESPLKKRVPKGCVLVAVNDTSTARMKFADVQRLLQR